MKQDLKDLAAYVAPCGIVGFILGLAQFNMYISILACFGAQYFFKKTKFGTLIGLSTYFFGPVAFISYLLGKSLVT